MGRGRPGFIAPDRAAAHIRRFRAAGLLDIEILAVLPIARITFYRILRGEPVRRDVEQRVLAVVVPAARPQQLNQGMTDATGTRRRLEALMARGWPAAVLDRRLGFGSNGSLRVSRRTAVRLQTEAAVRALYDALWNQVPEQHGVPGRQAEGARRMAVERGFVPPLAWDDDTIDDPAVRPQLDAAMPAPTPDENAASRWLMGESVVLTQAAKQEVIRHLMEWSSEAPAQIGARLEMNADAVAKAWQRIKSRARTEGRPVPWRRAYLPGQELGLVSAETTRNDMESAA